MGQDLTKGNPTKLILLFTLPILLGNLFQQFYSMADTFIVSQTLGVQSFAAVGSTGSINGLIIGLAIGVTAGLSVLTSQRYGQKDEAGIRRNLAASVIITAGVSLVLTTFSVLLARPILVFMQTPAELLDEAYMYIVILFAGISITMLFNLLSNVLRAIGDNKTPLISLAITSVLNIALDYFFILGMQTGVEGAAYATIISQLVASIFCLVYIWKKIPILRIQKDDWKAGAAEIREHLAISLPMGFQSSIIAIGAIAIQITLNRLGSDAVAATAAANKINGFATMPLMSFGITMATYTAQNYGAGELDRVWEGVNKVIKIVLGYSAVVGVILVVFGSSFAKIFIGDSNPEVVALTDTFFLTNATFYFLLALLFIYRYTLQGFGKSTAPTAAGMMELISRVVAAAALSHPFGFAGVSIAGPLAWLGALIPLMGSYYMLKRSMQGKSKLPMPDLAGLFK